MEQHFYIVVNGEQQGPFTIDDLKAKSIQRETLIWTEGLDSWTKAEDIPLLQDVLKATPPPIPTEKTKMTLPPIPVEAEANSPQISGRQTPINPNDKYFGYVLAGRWERLFATLLESICLVLPFLVFEYSFLLNDFNNDNPFSFESIGYSTLICMILGAIWYPAWSGNLGHKIMGLKVISSVDGSDLNSVSAGISREALKCILGYVLLPIIWLLWDNNKQNLYDKIVKSYVVKKKKSNRNS